MKTTNPNSHLRELIALTLVPNLGAQRIRALLARVEHPQDIFRLDTAGLTDIYGIGEATAKQILEFDEWDEVDCIMRETERADYSMISLVDEDYPPLLREIYDPPILLWIRGDAEVLSTDSLAIVGTRKASAYGKKMAGLFAKELAGEGLTIISGLAYGIDAAAHKATLQAGGKTIAVLGSGIDRIYPSKNIRIAFDMAEQGGAVISEFPPGTPPDAGNFPIRNRIVSGMSLGTLVVESDVKGGSMITASSALDQNREVFVVPHALDTRSGSGCNHLIRTGQGKLVETVEHILCEIQFRDASSSGEERESRQKRWRAIELDDFSRSICELLEESPRHIDEMGEELEVPTHKLLSTLLELEMKECVRQTAGKNFELI